MKSLLQEAFDEWRGVQSSPERPVGRILSESELAVGRQAFEGGLRKARALVEAAMNDSWAYLARQALNGALDRIDELIESPRG